MTDRLNEILKTMDVPKERTNDYRWLIRNLGIRNGNHPLLNEAIELLKRKLKSGV